MIRKPKPIQQAPVMSRHRSTRRMTGMLLTRATLMQLPAPPSPMAIGIIPPRATMGIRPQAPANRYAHPGVEPDRPAPLIGVPQVKQWVSVGAFRFMQCGHFIAHLVREW